MYDIEATVMTTDSRALKLTGYWPVEWLQSPGILAFEVHRELLPDETIEFVSGPSQLAEIADIGGDRPQLKVGSRVIVRCFLPGESVTTEERAPLAAFQD
jgi:hypothetical protein